MLDFSKLRWPYREDMVFSILSFIVFIVPLAFSLLTNENFETVKLVIWLVFLGLALFLWIAKRRSGGGEGEAGLAPVDFRSPAVWFALGIAAWALISALWAPDKWYSLFGFYYRFTNSFGFLALWSATFLLLLGTLDRERWIFLLRILALDAVLVAVKSLLEAIGLTLYLGASTDPFFRAAPSFLGNPNYSSMFVVCLLPMITVLCWQSKRFSAKLFYGIAVVLMLGSLVVLASRGALVGLLGGFVATLFLFLYVKGSRAAVFKIVAAAVLMLAVMLGAVRVTRPSVLDLSRVDDNVALRLAIWRKSAEAVVRYPVAGVGLGNFALYDERQARPADMGVFDDPHNLWIFLAVSGGIPLAVLFLGLIIYVVRHSLVRVRAVFDPWVMAALSSLAIFSVAASFTPVPIPLYLLLAVILAGLWVSSGGARSSFVPRWTLWLGGAAAIVFFVWGVALVSGETALHFGYNAFKNQDMGKAVSLLKFSRIANPSNQLAHAYYIQAGIRLKAGSEGADLSDIERQLAELRRLHPGQAVTRVLASDAEFIMYTVTKDSRYLDLAMEDIRVALEIDPNFPERYGQLGFFYYLRGDLDRAFANLERSLALKPDLLPSLLLKAKIYQERGQREKLLESLEQAYKTHLDDPRIRYVWYIAKYEPDVRRIPLNFSY